jgi:protein TonB
MKVMLALVCMSLLACTSQPPRPPTTFIFLPTMGVRHMVSPEDEARSPYQPGFHPKPEYPQQAKREGQKGKVLVRAWVDKAGIVQKVEIAESSGFPLLDAAAAKGVAFAKFKLRLENGIALPYDTTVTIGFALD